MTYPSLFAGNYFADSVPISGVDFNPAINLVVIELHFSCRLGLDEML